MRRAILAMVLAAGFGVFGTVGGASAAPIGGAAIGKAADTANAFVQVQHWRWGSRGRRWGGRGGHWRWGSRGGHRRWGSRGGGHRRWGSRGGRW